MAAVPVGAEKLRLVGVVTLTVPLAVTPMPLTAMVKGEPGALLGTLSTADRFPAAVGVNSKLT